jgi:hypothetical protein
MVNMRVKKHARITAVEHGDQKSDTAGQFVEQITTSWRGAVESIIRTGQLLVRAKAVLDHGEFGDMIASKLPFGARTAQMLMKIASHPIIGNTKHVSHLPPSWGTLHALTSFPDDALKGLLADGTINPEIQRSEVNTIYERIVSEGIYWYKDLRFVLMKLSKISRKQAHPVALAMYLCDREQAERDGGEVIEAYELSLLVPWLGVLQAACEGKTIDDATLDIDVNLVLRTAANGVQHSTT